MPPIPIVNLCGCARASAISSLRSFAGRLARPTSRLGTRAIMVIGVKSATGS